MLQLQLLEVVPKYVNNSSPTFQPINLISNGPESTVGKKQMELEKRNKELRNEQET